MCSTHESYCHRILTSPPGVTKNWDLIIYNAVVERSPSATDAQLELRRISSFSWARCHLYRLVWSAQDGDARGLLFTWMLNESIPQEPSQTESAGITIDRICLALCHTEYAKFTMCYIRDQGYIDLCGSVHLAVYISRAIRKIDCMTRH